MILKIFCWMKDDIWLSMNMYVKTVKVYENNVSYKTKVTIDDFNNILDT